jgi:hypothetical protein
MIKIKYLVVPFGVFFLSGCCISNYSSKMKEVLEPTQKKLVEFYAKSKHFPNIKERNKILKESGCEIKGNTCLVNGTSFNISDSNLAGGEYIIGLRKEKSRCNVGVMSSGKKGGISCYQSSCLGLKQ